MNKKAASGWYRWLWISPIFTIPTLVVSTDFLYYDIAKGILLSAAWHLILLIPSTNKQDPFIRWHGRQALLFAAARTITVLIFHEDLFFTVLLLIFIWFFGTLWGQKQAQEGKCFLMSTFAKDLDLDSLPFVQNTGSDKDSKDPKALVEIFRFSKDPLERQAALAQLEKLGLVEGLDRDLEDTFKKPISLEKPGSSSLKKEKRTTRSGWIIGAIIAVFIISLIIFSNYIKQVEQAQHIRTDTQIARTQNARTQIARTQIARTQISQRNTFSAKWPLTLSDTFVDNRNGWKIGSLSNDCYTGTRSIIDNSYVWEFSANSLENKFLDCSTEMKLIYSLQEISVEDFLLEVMVKSESNRTTSKIGLVFQYNPQTFFVFWVSQAGLIEVLQYSNHELSSIYPPYQAYNHFSFDRFNKLSVISVNNEVSYFLNDYFLGKFSSDTIPSGKIGLCVSLDKSGDHGIFEFKDFTMRVPSP